jgi:uncharacterized protein YndB with AHSA1/START domain
VDVSGAGDPGDEFGTWEASADGRSVLRYRRRLSHPPQMVWRALTEDGHLAAWFPTTIEGSRRAGAPLRFTFRQREAEPFDGEMLAFQPPSRMELRWADDVLRFELQPDDGGSSTVLHLIVTFPEHGKAARDGAGWHVCLERLESECDGTTPPAADRWRVVHARYVEALGPEASTIGPPG